MSENGRYTVSEQGDGRPQLTLNPKALEGFGVDVGDRVEVHATGDTLVIRKVPCEHTNLEDADA